MQESQQERPRGRAASEIRPGHFIKEWLEKVGESSISEAHQKLKSNIALINLRRPKAQRIRPPTYESFYKYFRRLRVWGLVEWVRDEPTVDVPTDRLLSIRMMGPWPDDQLPPTQVVRNTRRVYRLSPAANLPELAMLWDDPLARAAFGAALRAFMGSQPQTREAQEGTTTGES